MKQVLIIAALALSIASGCGTPGHDLFQGSESSEGAGAGPGGSDGGPGTTGGGSDGGSGDSGGPSVGSGASSAVSSGAGAGTGSGGSGGSGGATTSSTGTGCVPNACPSSYGCGDIDDGCGGTAHCGDCPSGSTCNSSDYQCYACNPTQIPSVACQPDNCGQYVDDCGSTQWCVPVPGDGGGGCQEYQYCTNGDLPWVPYASPTPDWNNIGTCTGCSRATGYDGICGASGDAYSCPSSYANSIQDETETDVDCGGFHPSKCDFGQACMEDSDCLENKCTAGVCSNTSMSNPGCLNLYQIWGGKDIVCCP